MEIDDAMTISASLTKNSDQECLNQENNSGG